jgi:hypothetical protein
MRLNVNRAPLPAQSHADCGAPIEPTGKGLHSVAIDLEFYPGLQQCKSYFKLSLRCFERVLSLFRTAHRVDFLEVTAQRL